MNYNINDLKLSFNNVTFICMRPGEPDVIENLKEIWGSLSLQ